MPADKADLSLKVLAISFPGIPAGDVKIDHVTRVISVKVPAEFTSDNMTPTVQVSDSAQVYGLDNLKSPALWCVCCRQNLAVKLLKKGAAPQLIRNQYVVNPVHSPADLTLLPLTKPIEVALGETAFITIPVSNLYRSVLPERAVLTNEKTGTQYVVYSPYSSGRVGCSYASANTINISLNEQKVIPGQYRVVLQMPGGREIPVPQPIIARAGKPYVSNNIMGFCYTGMAGDDITIKGENLYVATTTFRLVSATQPPVSLVATAQTVTGNQAMVTIPANTKPGYYAIEILQDGRSTERYYRVGVQRSVGQPTVGMVQYGPMFSLPLAGVVSLDRSKPVVATFDQGTYTTRFFIEARFKLISETDPSQTVTMPVFYPTENYSRFTVPPALPAGRYKLVVQAVNTETKEVISESEPFERVLDIR